MTKVYSNAFTSNHVFTKWQKTYLIFKRCFDCVLAILMLLLVWPLMVVAAMWVKLDSRGSVIFKQRRPGYHQKIFTLYKFRSMDVETVRDGRILSNRERITRPGTVLRKTSIDELPQLINIIKGEMSFIGPRPFLINDLGTYNKEQLIRFEVLPGITSWTAIHGRASVPIQEKYDYEIYYVNNIGFMIDLIILLKTIRVVFSCKNVEDVSIERIGAEIIQDVNTIN